LEAWEWGLPSLYVTANACCSEYRRVDALASEGVKSRRVVVGVGTIEPQFYKRTYQAGRDSGPKAGADDGVMDTIPMAACRSGEMSTNQTGTQWTVEFTFSRHS
jgi:hypothetical protein